MEYYNLSEVQIACLVLWRASERERLLEERKVQGLLEDYLVQQIEALPERQRGPAVAVLARLVTDLGTRDIVSRNNLEADVAKSENISKEDAAAVLNELVQKTGLVRQEFRDDLAVYEIISEFLVPWIREKQQTQKRLEAAKEAAELEHEIAAKRELKAARE